jgi:hypothetical protein
MKFLWVDLLQALLFAYGLMRGITFTRVCFSSYAWAPE